MFIIDIRMTFNWHWWTSPRLNQFLLHFLLEFYLSDNLYTTCRGRYPLRKTPLFPTKRSPKLFWLIITAHKAFGYKAWTFCSLAKNYPKFLWKAHISSQTWSVFVPAFCRTKKNVNNSTHRGTKFVSSFILSMLYYPQLFPIKYIWAR